MRKDKPRGGASLLCPKCKNPSLVLDTRRRHDIVLRRRICRKCKTHFSSRERRCA